MRVTIVCNPSYALAYCHLALNETVLADAGAMVAMSDGIALRAGTGGGMVRGLMRKAYGGETFFMGEYTAQLNNAWVAVAPKYPGDISMLELDGQSDVLIESGSLLAFEKGVTVKVTTAGVGNVLMREGITIMRSSGAGKVLLSSYGGIESFQLGPDQSIIVDTAHIAAYTAGMKTYVAPVAGIAASVASGEGLGMRFTGPGVLWIHTRAEQQLRSWLFPHGVQNERD